MSQQIKRFEADSITGMTWDQRDRKMVVKLAPGANPNCCNSETYLPSPPCDEAVADYFADFVAKMAGKSLKKIWNGTRKVKIYELE